MSEDTRAADLAAFLRKEAATRDRWADDEKLLMTAHPERGMRWLSDTYRVNAACYRDAAALISGEPLPEPSPMRGARWKGTLTGIVISIAAVSFLIYVGYDIGAHSVRRSVCGAAGGKLYGDLCVRPDSTWKVLP
jgi:hypothetical protein